MISILLPIYNGERYLRESIDSVLNQSFKNFELLVGFNGTIDNSKEILHTYNDPRIKIFDYGSDKGKAKTLNKLLKQSKYDWIALQDDDDIWIQTKLEKQILLINEYDVIGTFIHYINENGSIIGKPNLSTSSFDIQKKSIAGENQVANTSAIFKKLDTFYINGWKEELDGIEDYDFWLRLMFIDKKFINIPEELVHHRLHSKSNFNTKIFNLNKIL